MKKIFFSGAFKTLLASLLLFTSFAACIFGFLTLRAPLLYHNAKNVTQTDQFSSLFLKNVERTAVYVRYLEDGYSMHMTSYPPDLELLLQGDSIDQDLENYLLNVYEPSETAFYYYHSKLNATPSSYRYYVKNAETGIEYYSAGLSEYAEKKSGSLEEFLASGILSEPLYLIMNTGNNRTMSGGGNSSVLTRSNLLWSMDFLRRPLSDMAEENEHGYNYQVNPEVTAAPEEPNETSAVTPDAYTLLESKLTVSNFQDKMSSYLVYAFVNTSLAEDEFSSITRNYESAKEDYQNGITYTLIYSGLTLILFLLCNLVSGRRAFSDTVVLRIQDKLFTEVILLVLAGCLSLPFLFKESLQPYLREFVTNYPEHAELLPLILAGLSVFLLAIGFAYFSLVRRVKAGILFQSSFLGRFVVLPLNRLAKRLLQTSNEFFQSLSTLWRTLLQLIIAGLWLLLSTILLHESFTPGILLLLSGSFLIAFLFLRNALDRKRIFNRTAEMSGGNLSARIKTEAMLSSNKLLAEDINHICDGLHAAVEEQTKSERMKTELITNVSHDIKTPLTSIINFIELLKNELPKDGPLMEYAEILSQKSWRLKALIDDLVEASKASSGTIHLEPITFNFSELIKQAVGDFEERITERELTLCLALPEEPVSVLADGACTHRIIENLLSNVCKYALKGTRVYLTLDLPKDLGLALFTMKNVSKDVLNKTSEELLTRFSRGDDSRSDEGSGLGLSIAESLAKLQGGSFYVDVDGDLFKAKLTVPLAKKDEP